MGSYWIYILSLYLYSALGIELRCPLNWRPRPGSEKCYYFATDQQKSSWISAREFCQARNGDLIIIKSVEEKEWVTHEAGETMTNNPFWVGAQDAKENNNFLWVDNSSVNTQITPWNAGTPITTWFLKYPCVKLLYSGKINNDICSLKNYFVCQRSIQEPILCDSDFGWEHIGQSCYKYFDDKYDWADAYQECWRDGADLIVIDDVAERQYLEDLSRTMKKDLWFGYSNMFSGYYEWVVDTNATGNNWQAGYPSITTNTSDTIPMCGKIPTGGTMKWITEDCRSEYSFVCEHVLGLCAVGWESHGKSCYQWNFARSYSRHWEAANETCAIQSSQLVVMDTEWEQTWITWVLLDFRDLDEFNPDVWIGLSDIGKLPLSYEWVNGISLKNGPYNLWANSGAPGLNNETNCVKMIAGSFDPKWYRSNCETFMSFICKAPIGQPITPVHSTHAPLYCEDGWVQYHENCYKFMNLLKTWPEAEDDCNKYFGNLASITSLAENAWITAKIKFDTWIGLNDRYTEGTFVWTDKNAFKFTNWDYGEPNNALDENCVQMYYNQYTSYRNGKWNDHLCNTKNQYVCKKKANIDPSLTSTFAPTTPWSAKCGAYWLEDEYSHNCYRYDLERLSWNDAKTHCQKYGGNLVSILNLQEQRFVNSLANTALAEDPNIQEFWIGFTDKNLQGKWYWSDSQPSAFFNWDIDQPTKTAGKNCISARSNGGRWTNWECIRRLPYICKKSLGKTPLVTPVTYPPTVRPGQWYKCITGWKESSNECFFFSTEKKTWDDARADCRVRGVGGDLATIKSSQEQTFIQKNIMSYGVSDRLWIGLNDRAVVNEFRWIDGTSVTYTNWKANEPNKYSGENENCVDIYRELINLGNWNDDACNKKFYYICRAKKQIENQPTQTTIAPGCSKNDEAFEYSCYGFVQYNMTWKNASEYCETKLNGQLLDIENIFELGFITGKLSLLKGNFWIGLSSQQKEGSFTWSSGRPVTIVNWEENQPAGTKPQCVSASSGLLPGLWKETACNTLLGSICERPRSDYTRPPIPTTTITPLSCPNGWLTGKSEFVNYCYLNNHFLDRTKRKTFDQASEDCRQYGAEQTSIHSFEEFYFILMDLSTYFSDPYWLGMRAQNGSADYWLDGTPVDYVDWDEDEPNHNNGKSLCVEFSKYKWTHTNCEAVRNWICKASKVVLAASSIQPKTTTPVISTTPAVVCGSDPNWKLINDDCYFFSTQQLSWQEASDFCVTSNAKLASINNKEEQTIMTSKVGQYSNNAFWIGLHALHEYQKYEWNDGNPFDYTHWAVGEPNDAYGQEACVSIYTRDGFWNDDNCGLLQEFICRKPNNTAASFTFPPPTQEPQGNCPQDWLQFGKKCYKFFGNDSDMLTWQDALNKCKQLEANRPNLISIHSEAEQVFLMSQLYQFKSSVWIGLSDLIQSRNHYWSDNSRFDISFWGPNQPASYSGNCVMMIASGNVGKWKTEYCSTPLEYICQASVDAKFITPEPPKECQKYSTDNFVQFKENCFHLLPTSLTWEEAKSTCKTKANNEAVLASVMDVYEESFIRSFYANYLQNGIWIGLSDKEIPNSYRWTNGNPVIYTNWGANEPSKSDGEGCVAIMANGQWNDTLCKRKLNALCKIENVKYTTHRQYVEGICPLNTYEWFPSSGEFCYLYRPDVLEKFSDAWLKCKILHGDLATFDLETEFDFVFNNLPKKTQTTGIWIGLHKLEGKFEWVDSTPLTFTRWMSGEPFPYYNCVDVFTNNKQNEWRSNYCEKKQEFICKAPKVLLTTTTTSESQTTTTKRDIPSKRTPTKKLPTPEAQVEDKPGMPVGSIVGTCIGALLAVLAISLIIFMVKKKHLLSLPNFKNIGSHAFDNETYYSKENEEVTINNPASTS